MRGLRSFDPVFTLCQKIEIPNQVRDDKKSPSIAMPIPESVMPNLFRHLFRAALFQYLLVTVAGNPMSPAQVFEFWLGFPAKARSM
jgi:hypothetical protein